MKSMLLVSLFAFVSTNALADYDLAPFQHQRSKIEKAITARNQLLEEIGFTGQSSDAGFLASINSAELTVEFTLGALETYLYTLNNTARTRNPASISSNTDAMRSSLLHICNTQLIDMVVKRAELADNRIKNAVDVQIENVRTACDMTRGGIVADGKWQTLY